MVRAVALNSSSARPEHLELYSDVQKAAQSRLTVLNWSRLLKGHALYSILSNEPLPESGIETATKFCARSIWMAEFWPSC